VVIAVQCRMQVVRSVRRGFGRRERVDMSIVGGGNAVAWLSDERRKDMAQW